MRVPTCVCVFSCVCAPTHVCSCTCLCVSVLQGVIRKGLLSLRERYRLRGRELAEDGLVLAEQLDAARESIAERQEELAGLRRQVRTSGGQTGGERGQGQSCCVLAGAVQQVGGAPHARMYVCVYVCA